MGISVHNQGLPSFEWQKNLTIASPCLVNDDSCMGGAAYRVFNWGIEGPEVNLPESDLAVWDEKIKFHW